MTVTRKRGFEENFYIIDAKDSGYPYRSVDLAISNLVKNELVEDVGETEPREYVTDYLVKQSEKVENIFLAIAGHKIVGFLIKIHLEADTSYVTYLAVDSTIKKKGIGTQLMLTAMARTQELGKRYLTLEYIEGGHLNPKRSEAKRAFYNSFSSRFKIQTSEKDNTVVQDIHHIHPYYDLKGIDFNKLNK